MGAFHSAKRFKISDLKLNGTGLKSFGNVFANLGIRFLLVVVFRNLKIPISFGFSPLATKKLHVKNGGCCGILHCDRKISALRWFNNQEDCIFLFSCVYLRSVSITIPSISLSNYHNLSICYLLSNSVTRYSLYLLLLQRKYTPKLRKPKNSPLQYIFEFY